MFDKIGYEVKYLRNDSKNQQIYYILYENWITTEYVICEA